MASIFGNGLELFVPRVQLKAGDDMAQSVLDPPTVAERPLLTAAACQNHWSCVMSCGCHWRKKTFQIAGVESILTKS